MQKLIEGTKITKACGRINVRENLQFTDKLQLWTTWLINYILAQEARWWKVKWNQWAKTETETKRLIQRGRDRQWVDHLTVILPTIFLPNHSSITLLPKAWKYNIENIANNISISWYGDRWWLHFSWLEFSIICNCWIMMYTWNQYNIAYHIYFNKTLKN